MSEESLIEETEPIFEQSGFALAQVIEAILFTSQKPVSSKELIAVLKGAAQAATETGGPATGYGKVKEAQLREGIDILQAQYAETSRSFEVRETAAGWQLITRADYSPWLRQLFPENRSARISAPAMETLAIIAYRQPITRADIEAVRGVAVDGVMQTLLDRGLIRIGGRSEIPGRPLLYETTQSFMEHFGIKDLDDLPNAGELRTIKLPVAEIPKETPTEAATEVSSENPVPSEDEKVSEDITAETESSSEQTPS